MGIFNLYSRRQKPPPDVFTYDDIPHPLRIQLLNAMSDARIVIVHDEHHRASQWDCFAAACKILRDELGLKVLNPSYSLNPQKTESLCREFEAFFETCGTEHVLLILARPMSRLDFQLSGFEERFLEA